MKVGIAGNAKPELTKYFTNMTAAMHAATVLAEEINNEGWGWAPGEIKIDSNDKGAKISKNGHFDIFLTRETFAA